MTHLEKREIVQSVLYPSMIVRSHKLHKQDKKIDVTNFCDRLLGSFAKLHVAGSEFHHGKFVGEKS